MQADEIAAVLSAISKVRSTRPVKVYQVLGLLELQDLLISCHVDENYIDIFRDNGIDDLQTLLEFSPEKLKELGVKVRFAQFL